MKELQEEIIAISKKLHLSHIGSNLSCLPILVEIYEKKKPEDIVISSAAHSHLAHLLVMNHDRAEELIQRDIHCNRESGCDFSGGSLGHAIGAGIGMALVNRSRTVFVIVTEGSLQEGSEWEALRIKKELKLDNLKIIANLNGYTAVQKIDRDELSNRLKVFCPDIDIHYTNNRLPEFEGIQGHYRIIDEKRIF